MAKLPSIGKVWTTDVNYRLSLSYQRIPSWDAVTKLVRPSTCQICLCKGGLTHNFCFHTSDTHCPLLGNPPPLPLLKIHKTYAHFGRTTRQNA